MQLPNATPGPFRLARLTALGILLGLVATAACTATVGGPGGAPGKGPETGPAGGPQAGPAGSSAAGQTGTSSAGTSSSPGSPPSTTGAGAVGATSGGGGNSATSLQPPPPALVPTARLARLSRPQWVNTVKDLLKLSDISDVEANVSGDAVVGFDNDVDSLFVGETLRSDLADAAVSLAAKVTGDPTALARLMPPTAPTDLAGKARAFISAFGLRAYRRPLTDAEVAEVTGLFNQGPALYPGADPFTAGVSLALQLFLQSPHFLYRTELSTAVVNGVVPLSDYELASKLSYAIANTMPDDTLLAAAAVPGQLRNPTSANNLLAQATRLLASEAGASGRDHLHFQVLRLGAYDGIVRDPVAFPDFTPATPAAMRQEILSFLRWIFDQGYGVREIFTSPVGFVNQALAPIYQLPGTFQATQLTRVDLDPTQRSGLLTLAGFLSSYAIGNDPDSIHRGVFVNQRILCVTLPPPDPKATPLIDPQPDMTNRERVEKTTGVGTCGAACHGTLINPAGFAFEEFDAIGKFRTTDRGKPINSADTYPFTDGAKSYANAVEFSRAIAGSAQAHGCYTRNWQTYINGRALAPAEGPLADYFAAMSEAGKLSMKDMILAMVTNDAFINRLP